MRPLAIIFDMDGVLIDSRDAHYESWRMLAAEHGIELRQEQFLETFGRQNRDVIPRLLGDQHSADQIDALGERKESLYRQIARGRIRSIDGAVGLVRTCHAAGVSLAVGSSGHPENIRLALEEMGVADSFSAVVSGHDVSRGKPDPEVFLMAAERLGVAPNRCVVIEDAPAGIEAARRAGMTAVALTTTHAAAEFGTAHLVVGCLSEIVTVRGAVASIDRIGGPVD